MEETIYQQAWIQAFTNEMSEGSLDKARNWADLVAFEAVQHFSHAKMQAAITCKRKATDAAMEGK